MLDDKGHMAPTEVERELERRHRAALGHGLRHHVRSFVNIIATPKGGTHVAGFERALAQDRQRAAAVGQACCEVAEDDVTKDDILEGLTAVVTVRLAEPQFEGQTKEVLGTSGGRADRLRRRRPRSSRPS